MTLWEIILNNLPTVIVGMLVAMSPGIVSLVANYRRYNKEGGKDTLRADLAEKNLKIAQQASEYAEKLQAMVNERDTLLSAQKALLDAQDTKIEAHEDEIKRLKEVEIPILKEKVRTLEVQLADEVKKTVEQDAEIKSLQRIIKRPTNAKERSTDRK